MQLWSNNIDTPNIVLNKSSIYRDGEVAFGLNPFPHPVGHLGNNHEHLKLPLPHSILVGGAYVWKTKKSDGDVIVNF